MSPVDALGLLVDYLSIAGATEIRHGRLSINTRTIRPAMAPYKCFAMPMRY